VPHDAQPKERRHDRQPQLLVNVDEILDRCADPVVRAPLPLGGPLDQDAAVGHAWLRRIKQGVVSQGLTATGGNSIRRVVGVPATVGPAEVVKEHQWK